RPRGADVCRRFQETQAACLRGWSTEPNVYFESDQFNQPNDLAMATDGTIYASDPKSDGTGQVWRITRQPDGKVRGEVMSKRSNNGQDQRYRAQPGRGDALCRGVQDQIGSRAPFGLPLAGREAR